MSSQPSGTVTFVFTDIEGSTKIAQEQGAAWPATQRRHHEIVRAALEEHQGYVFQVIGDAFCAAFGNPNEAVAAGVAAQRALIGEPWGGAAIRVRMGVHTGPAEVRQGEYVGYLTLAQTQRVMAVAHGGQLLVSAASMGLLTTQGPEGVTFRDMGEHRLKGLLNPERLWQVMARGLPDAFPPLESLNEVPNNLPVQLTSFVGRERELQELEPMLAATRLLTLTGTGGTGKTRLSQQLAANVLDGYKDGVWFVELAPLADAALVPQAVAAVLGIRDEPGRPLLAFMLEWLRTRQLLLVLDNCEHVIEACARLAEAVLRAGRTTRILASSREALGIAGETSYRVPSLETPAAEEASKGAVAPLMGYAAVQLFVERARQQQTGFELTRANAPAIVQICIRLDGIPLAIELAAARVKIFPPEQIAARLDDRFRLLTGGSRTATSRQQTLRGAIDWSYSLLAEPERILLARLSIFDGGWYLDAAEAVCGDDAGGFDVLDLSSRLVEKSLVVVEQHRGIARYHLLETIRQYGREKLVDLTEIERLRGKHLDHYSHAATVGTSYDEDSTAEEFNRSWSDVDNYRAALHWCLQTGNTTAGLQIAGGLWFFWWQLRPEEGRTWLEILLARDANMSRTHLRAAALRGLASIEASSGQLGPARQHCTDALAIAHDTGASGIVIACEYLLGEIHMTLGDYSASEGRLREGLAVAQGSGFRNWIGWGWNLIGDLHLKKDNPEEAQLAFDKSVAVLGSLGPNHFLPYGLRRLGQLALLRAEYARANRYVAESLAQNVELGDPRAIAASLTTMAALRAAQGRHDTAVTLCAAGASILERLQSGMYQVDQDVYERALGMLRKELQAPEFDAAWAAGSRMTPAQANALALEESLA